MKYVSRMDIVQDMYTWMGCIAQWRKHLRNLELRILQKKVPLMQASTAVNALTGFTVT